MDTNETIIRIKEADIDAKGYQIKLSKYRCSKEELFYDKGIEYLIWNEKYYFQGTIKVTTLPIMNISTESSIVDSYINISLEVRDVSGEVIKSSGIIKNRGMTSREYPKKSFRIQLKKPDYKNKQKLSLLSMRKDDDWILYPAYNDHEKVRNVFCTNLWKNTCANDNMFGVDAGCEFRYIELFINNEYWGLYALGYPIDNKQMFIDDDIESGAIFKKNSWDYELDSGENRGRAITGYELYKKAGEYAFLNDSKSWELLYDYYEFYKENLDDIQKLSEEIDIDNVIDLFLFLNLIQGQDNTAGCGIKNIVLCLRKNKDGRIKALYAPWDMDYSFGNCFVDDPQQNKTVAYGIGVETNVLLTNTYIGAILEDKEYGLADMIIKKWKYLRNNEWSDDSIIEIIDQYEEQIYNSGAFIRDMKRWPKGSYNRMEERLSMLKKYLLMRLHLCDEHYNDWGINLRND